uniref:chitobiase/beta-hexosaminidase C-terminal domain-containing protein n=1 Tax=Alloprevotella sp. TaxID=1872471 RepID=UPI003FEF7159
MKTTLLSLKAFFTICLLCLVGGVNVMAQETYSYTFKSGDLKETTPKTYTFDKVEWNVSGKIAYIGWDANDSSKGIQLASKKKNDTDATFSTTNIPGTITSVKVNSSVASSGKAIISVKVGGKSWGTQTNTATTATSFDFTGTGNGEISIELKNQAAKALYIKSITVEYTTGNVISAPTITPTSQEFSKPFTATISPVEGATIYYTIDESDPRTSTTRLEYTTGVEIPAATTTLKACAVKGEATSLVSSATYTFVPIYENIADLKAVAVDGEKYYIDFKNAVVTYTNRNNAFVEDNSGAAIHIYQSHSLKAGNLLNGTTSVVYSVYSGDNQIKDIDFTKLTITEGADIPVTEVDIKTLNANIEQYESKRIRVKKALVAIEGAFDTKKQATLKQGENSIVLYKKGTANMNNVVKNDAIIDIIGYPLVHKTSKTTTNELTIWAGDDAVASTDKFTITPAQYGTYYTEDAFVMPEGVTGYTITEKNRESLTLNPAYPANEVVPAKTALLLKATEKPATKQDFTYTIVNSDEVAPAENLLHGSVEATETQVEGATAYYKLAQDEEEGIGFYWAKENGGAFTNGANKAYLAVKGNFSQMRGFSFESMTTGINNVVANTNNSKNAVIYDLNGRRVNSLNAAKGVYIVNGKKVIVK